MSAFLIGLDIGSSSVKASLLEIETGKVIIAATSPEKEMEISSDHPGWAEQDPETWWYHVKQSISKIRANVKIQKADIGAIGISYQMHGLVLIDKDTNVLRPSIIWCDSRAVEIGDQAFESIGEELCLGHMLNSPGNFTASKLKWVKDNEPEIYDKVYKFMLPGDYIALKLTGDIRTTASGLSEGILWDFKENGLSSLVMGQYGLNKEHVPELTSTFSIQGRMSSIAAKELGLTEGIPVAYRAGDQPNNAFSLNVLNAGEIAATAGTSGVIYGIIDEANYDPKSRVNTFVHVNHQSESPKYGVLLCINGTGIQNSWLKHNTGDEDYPEMNRLASHIPIGSDGLYTFPFGNGAERVLGNKDIGGSTYGLNFNRHTRGHMLRSAQEGIVFALRFGFDVMKDMGMKMNIVRAGEANMFLSPVFREGFVHTNNVVVELYNTDGSQGAARAAGIGAGIYKDFKEAFQGLEVQQRYEPDRALINQYEEKYLEWLDILKQKIL
jgi:xylulokinase